MSESGSAKLYTRTLGGGCRRRSFFPIQLLFLNRSKRLLGLAPGHQLESYLRFLRPSRERSMTSRPYCPATSSAEAVTQVAHGMPPIPRTSSKPDEQAETTIERFLDSLTKLELPADVAAAAKSLQSMTSEQRRVFIKNVLDETDIQDRIAQSALILAGLPLSPFHAIGGKA